MAMKTKMISLALALIGSVALSSICSADEGDSVLVRCAFRRSMSASFGYSYVYTFAGKLKSLGTSENPFYKLDGPARVAIDRTASTNTPGGHVRDAMAEINNHPWGNRVALDIDSEGFRIIVFPNPSQPGVWDAYGMDSGRSVGLAGTCKDLDPKMVSHL
jgi:hypothetical protein